MKLEAVLKMLLKCLIFVSAVFFYCAFKQESELAAGQQMVHELNKCHAPQPDNHDTDIASVSYTLQSSPCDNEKQFESQIEAAYDHYAVSKEYGRVAKQMALPFTILLWLFLPLLAIIAGRLIRQNPPPS